MSPQSSKKPLLIIEEQSSKPIENVPDGETIYEFIRALNYKRIHATTDEKGNKIIKTDSIVGIITINSSEEYIEIIPKITKHTDEKKCKKLLYTMLELAPDIQSCESSKMSGDSDYYPIKQYYLQFRKIIDKMNICCEIIPIPGSPTGQEKITKHRLYESNQGQKGKPVDCFEHRLIAKALRIAHSTYRDITDRPFSSIGECRQED